MMHVTPNVQSKVTLAHQYCARYKGQYVCYVHYIGQHIPTRYEIPIFEIRNIKCRSEASKLLRLSRVRHFPVAYGCKLMGEHSFLMNTLSLRDQRTVPGICCLLSFPCEMKMWPHSKESLLSCYF